MSDIKKDHSIGSGTGAVGGAIARLPGGPAGVFGVVGGHEGAPFAGDLAANAPPRHSDACGGARDLSPFNPPSWALCPGPMPAAGYALDVS